MYTRKELIKIFNKYNNNDYWVSIIINDKTNTKFDNFNFYYLSNSIKLTHTDIQVLEGTICLSCYESDYIKGSSKIRTSNTGVYFYPIENIELIKVRKTYDIKQHILSEISVYDKRYVELYEDILKLKESEKENDNG